MPSPLLSRGLRLSIAVASFAVAVAASADTKSYSFDTGKVIPEQAESLSLSRFDPMLGTLTGVSFEFEGQILADLDFQSVATSGTQTGVADLSVGMTLKEHSTGSSLLDLSFASGHIQDALAHGASKHYDFTPVNGTYGNVSAIVTNPLALGYVTGTSPLMFDFDNVDDSSTDFKGENGFANYDTTVRATGKIIYTYTPQAVPEPTSVAALGLGALGLLRRRARKGGVR